MRIHKLIKHKNPKSKTDFKPTSFSWAPSLFKLILNVYLYYQLGPAGHIGLSPTRPDLGIYLSGSARLSDCPDHPTAQIPDPGCPDSRLLGSINAQAKKQRGRFSSYALSYRWEQTNLHISTTGQVVEYRPARVETRVRFPGDTFAFMGSLARLCRVESPSGSEQRSMG